LFNYFIYVNLKRSGLDDANVRRAMLYAWDRKAMVEGLLHGDAVVSTGFLPVALRLWYDPNVRRYPYEPDQARSILDAAGWRLGTDGIRVKAGRRLSYELLLDSADASVLNLAAEFQADMRAIGVALSPRTLDFSTFLAETQSLNYDLAFSGWGGSPDPDQLTLLGSNQTPPTGNNIMSYSNPDVDRDVSLGLQTLDYKRRRAYYDSMQRITAEDLPVLFGYTPYSRTILNPRVHISVQRILPDQYLFRDIFAWRLGP
jgi:peptide/nickel transport system substrate-binding protein